MAAFDEMTEDERGIAEDYHDNAFTGDLVKLLGDGRELDRLNAHRGTDWTQAQLDRVLRAAIQMRTESGGFTVAIVATGPSTRDVDLAAIEADTIIAVNGAIELLTPDIWFSLDLSPANLARLNSPVPGVQYVTAVSPKCRLVPPLPDHVRQLRRIEADRPSSPPVPDGPEYWMWRWSAMPGLSEDPEAIHTGNSAYGALGLAYHLRPRLIILYGVDGTRDPRATGGRPRRLDHLPMLFASAMPQLRAAGIEVLNTSIGSKITCFDLKEK